MDTNEKIDLVLLKLDSAIEKIDERFEIIDQRFEKIDQRFEKIDQRFEKIDNQLSELKTGQEEMNTRLTHLELLCENEIPKKIQFVAEGHSILFRRLDDITKQLSDREYDKIRMDVLESRVNRLEECVL